MSNQYKTPASSQILTHIDLIITWLEAVEIQGNRVLENVKTKGTSRTQKTMDEHFFLIAAKQACSYMDKKKLIPELKSKTDKNNMFSSSNKSERPILTLLRDMREHGVQYLHGHGDHQNKVMHNANLISAHASASIIISGDLTITTPEGTTKIGKSYLLGNRVDVYAVMNDAKAMLPVIRDIRSLYQKKTLDAGGMGI